MNHQLNKNWKDVQNVLKPGATDIFKHVITAASRPYTQLVAIDDLFAPWIKRIFRTPNYELQMRLD